MQTEPEEAEDEFWMVSEVAYLISHGWPGTEIATELNVSEATVTKLKKKALTCDPPLIELPNHICHLKADMQVAFEEKFVRPKNYPNHFEKWGVPQEHLPRHIRIIYHNVPDVSNDQKWEAAAFRFGRNVAASRLIGTMLALPETSRQQLFDCRSIGVCYSRVVRSFIDGLTHRTLGKRDSKVVVAPLWPEPLTKPMVGSHVFAGEKLGATRMAADLDRILNSGSREPLSLQFMPAFKPKVGTRAHKNFVAAMPYLRSLTAYDIIFGPPDDAEDEEQLCSKLEAHGESASDPSSVPLDLRPLVQNFDAILAGVGVSKEKKNLWNGAFWNQGEIQIDELAERVIGDIGGCFIPDPTHPDAAKVVDDFELRWNGIKAKHLKSCAERARRNRALPGVIAFAIGRRGKILLEAMKLGWINGLFMDQTCAADLDSILGIERSER